MHTQTHRSLSRRLDREWAALSRRHGVIDRVRSWNVTDDPFGTLDELLVLTGHHVDSSRAADELLGRLVSVAQSDPLACRIVLQRILPGLLAIVKAEQSRDPRVDAFDLIIGEAWISIMRYRVDARPTHVAARLLNDARHRAFTSQRRRRAVEEVACAAETFAATAAVDERSPFDVLIGTLVEARRHGLGDQHVAAVGDYLRHGSSAGVASERGITARAARYRQHRAAKQIRRLVAA